MGNKKTDSPGEISAVSTVGDHRFVTNFPRLYQIFLVKQRDKILLGFSWISEGGAMSASSSYVQRLQNNNDET